MTRFGVIYLRHFYATQYSFKYFGFMTENFANGAIGHLL